jgi:hypothetical protein
MASIYNHFKDRLGDTVKRVKRKLLETSSNTPRGVSTSNIKNNRDLYRCGGTKFKNRY